MNKIRIIAFQLICINLLILKGFSFHQGGSDQDQEKAVETLIKNLETQIGVVDSSATFQTINAIEKQIALLDNDSVTTAIRYRVAKALFNYGRLKKTGEYLILIKDEVDRYESMKFNYLDLLGDMLRNTGRFDSAKQVYHLQREIASSSLEKAKNYKNMAYLESMNGNLVATASNLYKAISYFEKENNINELSNCFYLLAINSASGATDNYPEAINHFKKSIQYDTAQVKSKRTATSTLYIAECFFYMGALDSAEYYYKQAIPLYQNINQPDLLSDLYIRLGLYYEEKNELDSAKHYYLKAYPFKDLIEDTERKFALLGGIMRLHLLDENFKESKAILDEMQQLLGFVNLEYNAMYHEFASDHYSATEAYEHAFRHQKKFTALKDSLLGDQYEKGIADLRVNYETEKKDQEIENLTQQATIQSLKLSQRNNQLLIGGLAVGIVLVAALFYYRSYRIKKEKSEKELEQRFLRSQLNPHFIFNSMTAIQNYLIAEKDMEQASYYMGMFSSLMRQILENSRQEFITLGEEIKMIKNYLELQKVRFSDNFTYEIEVDEHLNQEYSAIPPMFAQPFLENSLEHGLFRDPSKENKINIRFKKADKNLIHLELEDTGIGIQEKTIHSDHKSLATTITRERLASFNASLKEKLGFDNTNIYSSDGKISGYRVNLTLPSEILTTT